jgi:lysophospholipase
MVQLRNDGQSNLQGALIIASHFVIPEVTLFFDNKLLRGNRATKVLSLCFNLCQTSALLSAYPQAVDCDD